MVVVGDDFDLAAVDATLGVDLVGGHLGGLRDRRAGDRLGFGNHADFDGIGGQGLTGSRRQKTERSRSEQFPH